MKVSVRVVVILIVTIVCALLILFVIWPMITSHIEFSIPKDREVLVRYYACSLALCTHGCDSDVVKDICLYNKDTDTQECIEDPNSAYKTCQDFCDNPPVEGELWKKLDGWDEPGKVCGSKYSLTVPLQKEAHLKGCIKFYPVPQLYETEMEHIFKYLNEKEDFPLLKKDSKPWILSLGCLQIQFGEDILEYSPGFLFEKTESEQLGLVGMGSILIDDEEVYENFGCEPKIGQCLGLSSCKFHGKLKIWSVYKEKEKGVWPLIVKVHCADVRATTSMTPPEPTFDLNVKRSEGKEECGGVYKEDEKCERINIGDTAEFNATISHDYDTPLPFTLAIESYSPNDDQDLGCDPPCSLKFNPNPIIVDSGIPGTSKLTFDDIKEEAETYTIRIIANKPDGYDTQVDRVTLKVVNIEVSLSPEEEPVVVQPDVEGTFTLKIVNHIDEDIEFTLSYVGPEACTCTDWEDDPIGINTLTVDSGTSETRTIKCSSDEVGEHQIAIRAIGGGFDETSNYATLKVTECDASGIGLSISSNPKSGETVTLTASDLVGCAGEEVVFAAYQNDPDFRIGFCTVPPAGDGCDTTKNPLTANTPGTYDIYAIIEGIASTETPKTLTIEVDPPEVIGYTDKPGKPCSFDVKPGGCLAGPLHICDYCNVIVPSNCACPRCCDPQTCKGLTPSNLCCICGSDFYSNGPPGAPCLSPDTNTHDHKTENIWLWDVKFPRDLLVSDNIYATWGNRFSTIIGTDICDEVDDCNGGSGAPDELDSAECVFNRCRLTEEFGDKTYRGWEFIRISHDSRPVYGLKIEGWPDLNPPDNPCTGGDDCEFIITQYECEDLYDEFHPEFDCTWEEYDPIVDSRLDIYLHKKTGEWVHIETLEFEGLEKNEFYIRPPDGEQLWKGIDAILLTNVGSDDVMIDYVGLLAKGDDIPYCMDGDYDCTGTPHPCDYWVTVGEDWEREKNCRKAGCEWSHCIGDGCDIYDYDKDSCEDADNEIHPGFDCVWLEECTGTPKPCDKINYPTKTDCEYHGCSWSYQTSYFNRIVDNGEKCYWGLDCPKTDSNGWEWTESTGVGPFGECKCDSDLGHCDEGYCITYLSLTDGSFLCYYNVVCANGGWRNPLGGQPHLAMQVCNPEQVCDPNSGCVGD